MFLIPFMMFIWNRLNPLCQIIGLAVVTIQLSSYIICAFSNPGFPKRLSEAELNNYAEQGKQVHQCKKCFFYSEKGQGTCHCFECDVCVVGIKTFFYYENI